MRAVARPAARTAASARLRSRWPLAAKVGVIVARPAPAGYGRDAKYRVHAIGFINVVRSDGTVAGECVGPCRDDMSPSPVVSHCPTFATPVDDGVDRTRTIRFFIRFLALFRFNSWSVNVCCRLEYA